MGFDFFWEGYNGCYLDKLVMYWLAPGNIQQLCDEKSKTCFYVFCAVFSTVLAASGGGVFVFCFFLYKDLRTNEIKAQGRRP